MACNGLQFIYHFIHLQHPSDPGVKLRYNNNYGELTKNNIEAVDEEIETIAVESNAGVTTCDLLLPPHMKLRLLKECKFQYQIIVVYVYTKFVVLYWRNIF